MNWNEITFSQEPSGRYADVFVNDEKTGFIVESNDLQFDAKIQDGLMFRRFDSIDELSLTKTGKPAPFDTEVTFRFRNDRPFITHVGVIETLNDELEIATQVKGTTFSNEDLFKWFAKYL